MHKYVVSAAVLFSALVAFDVPGFGEVWNVLKYFTLDGQFTHFIDAVLKGD